MTKDQSKDQLLLPNLTVGNFLGIDNLTLSRLGRVTLLAGKNSVGKTTLLDAIRIYAARGRSRVLSEILRRREEVFTANGDADSPPEIDWTALFHGRGSYTNNLAFIGPTNADQQLRIEISHLTDEESSRLAKISPELLGDEHLQVLKITYGDYTDAVPRLFVPRGDMSTRISPRSARGRFLYRNYRSLNDPESPPEVSCESIGPGLLDNSRIAGFWDSVVLTKHADHPARALRLIFGDDIDGVAMIGESPRSRPNRPGRRAIVKLKGHEWPVPLRSLGDGALRLCGIALALANCHNGFLLLDEAENGIHYSLQSDFWRMVLRTAHENNVQVVATTHSWDCVRGFARAAKESADVEGILVRLDKNDGDLRPVLYSEKNLGIAAEQGIEVR